MRVVLLLQLCSTERLPDSERKLCLSKFAMMQDPFN